nr:LytTR family transcriptional regulator DNA-binding domain-containing protein [Bacteroidota bacterium]
MNTEKQVKAIIIDDEELARKVIIKYLDDHDNIKIMEECENGFSGLKAINNHIPDIIFLDIQMPKINGFELLEILDEKPVIIFSTAHDDYAIKAFEHSAVDYLLKPYSKKRFDEALKKALERIGQKNQGDDHLMGLKREIEQAEQPLQRIVVKSGNQVDVIPVNEIEYIQSADDYVEIFTGAKRFLKQKPLKYFELNLDPELFIRVHRSYIVAVDQITKLEPYSKDSFVLILKNGTEITVSKSGLQNLRSRLQF